MSEIIRSRYKGVTENTTQEDLVKVDCLKKECAMWGASKDDGLERCQFSR
jgi:hypothetical protein